MLLLHTSIWALLLLKLLDALGVPLETFTEASNRIRERAKATQIEEKFSGAKEKGKMTEERRQKDPTMPLDKPDILC